MAKLVTADFSTNNELCVLYYTTTNSKKLYFKKDAFDAEIQSHTYEHRGKIVFDKPISRIGRFSFCEGEYYLRDVVIPSSVTHIENNAFHRCSELETIHLSNKILSIDKDAFYGCNSLKNVQYKGGVASWCKVKFGNGQANPLHKGAKLYLNGVEAIDIQIPSEIAEIQADAFYGYSAIKSVNYNGDISGWLRIKFGNRWANPLYKGAKLYLNGVEATDIQIPLDIKEIQASAFYGCTSIKSIAFSNNVSTIGQGAFGDCINLAIVNCSGNISYWSKINFEDSAANPLHRGAKLYLNSTETTEVIIPSDITEIKAYAFVGSSLNRITISNSVTSIGEEAFRGCKLLSNIKLPNSITSIGGSAFSGCESLKEVVIPDSVTSISGYTFHGCSSLSSVTISNSVVEIGDGAFGNCQSLKSITVPNSVTSIGKHTFWDCKDIKVNIPESVTYIGEGAFYNCTGELHVNCNIVEQDIRFSDPYKSWLCRAYFSRITIGNNIRKIGSTLSGLECLKEVNIPDTVTSIGNGAFSGCGSLREVNIPDTVTSIGSGAFSGCRSLKEVNIPDTVTSIGESAFSNCRSLPIINGARYADTLLVEVTDVEMLLCNIKEGTRFIGHRAFWNCYPKNITIPKSVISIGSQAFYCCPSMNVHISDLSAWCKINFIGKEANPIHIYGAKLFLNGVELKDIVIPSDVASIRRYAFYNYRSLTNITIPDSVTSIGEEAFKGCWGLTNITISDGVISIGKSAFEDCDNVETIALGKNVSVIGKRAFMGQHLKTVISKAEIPPKLEETNNGEGYYYLDTFGNFETLIIPTGCELAYAKSDWNRFITENLERFDLEENLEYKAWRKEQERLYGVEDDYDAEYESYLALGGDPEKYKSGCLDDYMDSIGL